MQRLLFIGPEFLPQLTGFIIHRVRSVPDALNHLATSRTNVVVLSSKFDESGIVAHLRRASHLPLLCLSNRFTPELAVSLLEAGAHAVLDEQVDPAELAARLQALWRRHGRSEAVLRAPPFTLDLKAHTVWYGETSWGLLPMEFEVLACLARNAGQVCSREVIMEAVWGKVYPNRHPNLNRYVSMIRRSLRVVGADSLLMTVRGQGWLLCVRHHGTPGQPSGRTARSRRQGQVGSFLPGPHPIDTHTSGIFLANPRRGPV